MAAATPMVLTPIVLEGTAVRLEPLTMAHLGALAAFGLDEELWRLSPAPVRTAADMATYLAVALAEQAAGRALPFAIVERASGTAVGSTRYGAIERSHRRLEIGWTWLGRAWQRTAINTEAKLLLLTHAFEALGCIRVELKTDVLNLRSRAGIERLGAREEGIFRKHMITAGGRVRDSIYYAIVDDDWPGIKARLRGRLVR
jgi:RimJ/RimL family protein N-acetyltransferase